MEEGASSQGMQAPREAGKGKEMGSPLELPEEPPRPHLKFGLPVCGTVRQYTSVGLGPQFMVAMG